MSATSSLSNKAFERALSLATVLTLFGAAACGESFDEPSDDEVTFESSSYIQHFQELSPMCTIRVDGGGSINVEDQYLPGVVACENGNADFEALKAQAIAARTFLKYKIDIEGISSIRNSQRDQVSSCGRTPTEEHRRAVRETSGQVITHNGNILAAFYVSGVMPSTSNCRPSSSDIARASSTDRTMEQRITYNEGQSGASVRPAQRPMGFPGNPHNRGVMSQNGSSCLSMRGRDAHSILRFYYGDDIRIEQLGGDCVSSGSVTPDQGPSRPEPSTPGNPQDPNTSGVTDNGATTGGGGSTSAGSCTNGGVLSNILPRSIWGATPPTSNRPQHTPNRITFHHTVQPEGISGPSAVRQIQNWHKQAYGMADIGYHYVIDRDGTVYNGTPVDRIGAHQKGQNEGNIGVAFIGSFGAGSAPTSQQIQSAVGLGLQVANQFGFSLGSDSLLGGFLNGTGGQIIGSILDLLFGGGGSSGGLCSGSVNGSPNNGISPGTGVEGAKGNYNYIRITASPTNQDPFPVDAVELNTVSTTEVLDGVVKTTGVVTSANGATSKDGNGCTSVVSGQIATLAPGSSIVLWSVLSETELNAPTGQEGKFYTSTSGSLTSCVPVEVGGTAKIEISEDGDNWVLVQDMVSQNTTFTIPSLQGNTSGGGTGGGTGGGGGTVDPGTATLNPSGNPGGNNGSGGTSPGSANINQSLAERLASEADNVDGQRSQGRCWRYVKQAAGRAGLSGFGYTDPMASKGPCSSYNYQLSAYCGGRNWNANPNDLQSAWGFTKLDVHPTEAPRGAIIFWDKGCNGYHATHGHVEISLGDGRACSDYCGRIKSGGGSCSYVFVPTGN